MHKPLKERVRAGRWGRAADTLGHSAPINLAGVSQKWPEGDGRDQEWLSLFQVRLLIVCGSCCVVFIMTSYFIATQMPIDGQERIFFMLLKSNEFCSFCETR